jgi:ABC-type branched-subunit amino acid transport system ATPase component
MSDALTLHDIGKQVGGVRILSEVSLSLAPGERRALIGPNGAGKTTLFNIAAGLIRPSCGRVLLAGADVTRIPAHRRARRGLARTFQITNLLGTMTVAENVAMAVQATGRRRYDPVRPWRRVRPLWERVAELLERARLDEVRDMPVGRLPYGQQRRLEVVVAAARPCSVILLDEPGAGLTTAETEELMNLVFGLGDELAVMFVDHDVDLALRLATRVTVLERGRVVAEGTPAQIRGAGVLAGSYLGRADV